jgi:cyanophycinase
MRLRPWRLGSFLAALGAALLCSAAAGAAESADAASGQPPAEVRGSLVIVGGGALPVAVRDQFLALAGGREARLVIIPTASARADRPELQSTFFLWRPPAAASVVLLHTRDRATANDPAFVKPLTEATGVWLAGGDQSLLAAAYHGTLVEAELRRLLARGGVIGGTSAGAAVMSQVMIAGGTTVAELGEGFGLLPGVVVDMHFTQRRRLPRLLGALTQYPTCLGLGIDEQTAVVVTGHSLSVVGNADVRVCQPLEDGQADVRVLHTGAQADLLALTPPRAAAVGLALAPAPKRKPAAPAAPGLLSP